MFSRFVLEFCNDACLSLFWTCPFPVGVGGCWYKTDIQSDDRKSAGGRVENYFLVIYRTSTVIILKLRDILIRNSAHEGFDILYIVLLVL